MANIYFKCYRCHEYFDVSAQQMYIITVSVPPKEEVEYNFCANCGRDHAQTLVQVYAVQAVADDPGVAM
jgi:hypothetical protein